MLHTALPSAAAAPTRRTLDARACIADRLQTLGQKPDLLTDDAVDDLMAYASGSMIRLRAALNRALSMASVQGAPRIGRGHMVRAIESLAWEDDPVLPPHVRIVETAHEPHRYVYAGVAGALVLAGLELLLAFMLPHGSQPQPAAQPATLTAAADVAAIGQASLAPAAHPGPMRLAAEKSVAVPAVPRPAEPAIVTAAPFKAASLPPAPATSAPVTPAPVEPAPVESAPVESGPVKSAQVAPAPVRAAPAGAAPVTPAPWPPVSGEGRQDTPAKEAAAAQPGAMPAAVLPPDAATTIVLRYRAADPLAVDALAGLTTRLHDAGFARVYSRPTTARAVATRVAYFFGQDRPAAQAVAGVLAQSPSQAGRVHAPEPALRLMAQARGARPQPPGTIEALIP